MIKTTTTNLLSTIKRTFAAGGVSDFSCQYEGHIPVTERIPVQKEG